MTKKNIIPAVFTDLVVKCFPSERGASVINLVLDLVAPLERSRLTGAVRKLGELFPILRACYKSGWLADHWLVDVANTLDRVLTVEDVNGDITDATNLIIKQSIDPERDWPVSFHELIHPNGARLIIRVHHIIGDGAGSLAIAEYLGHCLFTPEEDIPPPHPDRSLTQLVRVLRWGQRLRLIIDICRSGGWARFFSGLPATRPLPEAIPAAEVEIRYQLLTLTGRDYEHFRHRCKLFDCTINDLLVAAFFFLQTRSATPSRYLLTYYTMNLRRYYQPRTIFITNHSAMIPIFLGRADLNSLAATVDRVKAITRQQKQDCSGLATLLGPGLLLGWLPAVGVRRASIFAWNFINWLIRQGMAMTNIGPLDEYLMPFGPRVRDAFFLGPFMPNQAMPLTVISGYRDHLHILFGCYSDIPRDELEHLRDVLREILLSAV
jgi:NRPS condensation-like uncharacterized protein